MNHVAEIRLEQLSDNLAKDPENVPLLIETIEAAFDATSAVVVDSLVSRLKVLQPGSEDAKYFTAIWFMMDQDYGEAAEILAPMVAAGAPPKARFNLAWCMAMLGQKSESRNLLDAGTISQFPAAAMLKVQLTHESGDIGEAIRIGQSALAQFPNEHGLNAAIATVALDGGDVELARRCAERGGDHPEALAAGGFVAMNDGTLTVALDRFDRAIALRQHNPRAWLGRGLARMSEDNHAEAARDLDCAAQQFADRIGPWLAAGLAHLLARNLAEARQRLGRARALDPSFAETHGALAVLDAAAGDPASARLRMATARRHDPASFALLLAGAMAEAGGTEAAWNVLEQAITAAPGDTGLTIPVYLAKLAQPPAR